ncbi:DUF983 domain-containing protein [Enterovirga sp.]|jgi:uncharacterized protein (DUF983 family)|uniref:DUF983 domain-containing protein n=1 Tax=Enterovirga sp. TaxID=2026350 RepID=UPI0026354B30|nr:DUF983 domain-containing protein [Enterovirga sp.]
MSTVSASGSHPPRQEPGTLESTWRALRGRCPACGEGHLFGRFLKVAPHCTDCGQPFHHHRADDFPPYIVMFVVGHLLGYGIYVAETRFEEVPLWLHAMLWPSLAVGLCLALLQPVKGAVIGWQYGLGMHGFARASGSRVDERRTGGEVAAELRLGRPETAVAEPATPGRRDADHPRPLG